LGLNRNIAAATALIALPLLLSKDVPDVLRRVRWPLAGLSVTWIVLSRSRLVILAAAFGGLVWVLVQPNVAGKARKFVAAIVVALVVLLTIQEVGGDARIGLDRATAGFSSDKSTNDVRRLLVRKAWHLAEENPAFGIGLGSFPGAYHPVLEEASSTKVRRQAINSYDHNGYAGMLAEAGFPAFLLLIGLFASLVRAGLSNRGSGSARVAFCSFAIALVYMTAASLPGIMFAAMAVVLGAAIENETKARPASSVPLPRAART